jgi:leucyl-tRNA synthetase
MHKKFDSSAIEKKWQATWKAEGIYDAGERDESKEKEYVLVEWPYPSGNLHIGHWYAFAVPDIYVRFKRMMGKQVLFPIGFDAFGLPAENAAIKRNINPREWTAENIAYMKDQLTSMGNAFSWDKTTSSTDPEYYKWTQWMFTQFFERGIAYRGKGIVNWCPGCNTVIANEQVLADGTCERSGDVIEKREMPQWMLKITDYADRLVDDLDALDWPEHIKEAQRQWIGRSKGAEIDFQITTTKKHHYVILHGFMGASDQVFIPWLKTELERQGHTVDTPNLPNTEEPTPAEQVEYVLNNCHFDEDTILVGHSLGAVVALKVAERLNLQIKKLVLVAGFLTPDFNDSHRNFEDKFDWIFNFDRIQANSSEITILSAINDTAVGLDHGKKLQAALGGRLIEFTANKNHVCGDQEEVVLKHCLPFVTVFTTRPDTLFGATYLVLAPEHPLLAATRSQVANWAEVDSYMKQATQRDEQDRLDATKEKTGVKLEGVSAINPASGEVIPVFVADYVLGGYGTGAIMAVPAHDERDFAFATKFNLPIVQSIVPCAPDTNNPPQAGYEEVKRDTVIVHLRDKSTGKFALLNWHGTLEGITTAIMGGIEAGQTPEEAALAEIKEEAALTNVTITKRLKWVTAATYCASHKKQNRCAHSFGFIAEVDSLATQGEIPESEQKIHTLVWVSEDEVLRSLTPDHQKQVWQLLNNETPLTGKGYLMNSGEFDGMDSKDAKEAIVKKVGGQMTNTYRLRDWSIGRQRYWGVPIPIVYDPEGKAHPVPREHLPWTLPEDVDFKPTGEAPLAKSAALKKRTEEIFGTGWTPEVETMDTFVDSSWYFLRYIDNHNDELLANPVKQKQWLPVDIYFGGAEHTTMHLLYSRFWQKALYDLGVAVHTEPYKRRINRGLILGPDGNKMSKSKGNVIDPDEQVKLVGADTVKMYLAFMGPYEGNNYPWDMGGIAGLRRFLERVYGLTGHLIETEPETVTRQLHKTIKKVAADIQEHKFNTAISAMMIFVNLAEKEGLTKETFTTFLAVLAPFAPHLTEEIWHEMGHSQSIHQESFPVADERLAVDAEVTIGVQINGKMRGTITVRPDASEAEVLGLAMADAGIIGRLGKTAPSKVIYVPGKILNLIHIE